jgi:hypothetical protein
MIISIHQPAYLPWLGYFDKINKSDLFIFLDTVQFQKNSFQNRNLILKKNDTPMWLTVPIEKNHFEIIHKIKIHNGFNWKKKHYDSIRFNYSGTKNFNKIFRKLHQFYNREWVFLNDICYDMLIFFCDLLNIKTKIIKLSEEENILGQKSDLILNICKKYNAKTYYSGINGKSYLDLTKFEQEKINVIFQNFILKEDIKKINQTNYNNYSIIEYIMKYENLQSIIL